MESFNESLSSGKVIRYEIQNIAESSDGVSAIFFLDSPKQRSKLTFTILNNDFTEETNRAKDG